MSQHVPGDEPGESADAADAETPHGWYVMRGVVDPETVRGLRAALDHDLGGEAAGDPAESRDANRDRGQD